MSLDFDSDVDVCDGVVSLDFVIRDRIDANGRPIAIVVSTFHSCYFNVDNLMPEAELRVRLARKLGYHVLHVPFYRVKTLFSSSSMLGPVLRATNVRRTFSQARATRALVGQLSDGLAKAGMREKTPKPAKLTLRGLTGT